VVPSGGPGVFRAKKENIIKFAGVEFVFAKREIRVYLEADRDRSPKASGDSGIERICGALCGAKEAGIIDSVRVSVNLSAGLPLKFGLKVKVLWVIAFGFVTLGNMRRYFFTVFILAEIFVLSENAFCTLLRLDFSQDNRTYLWNTKLDYSRLVDRGFFWGFSSAINSMLIQKSLFSNNQNRWQEDGNLGLNAGYSLSPKLKLGVLFAQDVNSLEKRKVQNSEYGITTEYQISGIHFSQVIGGKDVQRRWEGGERDDAGFHHQLEISNSPDIINGANTRLYFRQTSSALSNVPLLERDFSLFFAKTFTTEDSVEFTYQEDWSKKKFYLGDISLAQINTQRRSQRLINLKTSTRIPLQLRMDFDFDFLSDGYKYSGEADPLVPRLTNNSISSQNLNLKLSREFLNRVALSSYYKYLQSDEDYTEDYKDLKMKSAEWGGNLTMRINRSDSLCFTISVGVTSFYASPSSDQLNDRDLLTFSSWGIYRHVFNPLFSLQVEGGFRNLHQVYISNRLSANNNHNQTYVLSPTFFWQPFTVLGIKQNYNIQANYIYYDYEKETESTKNRLFRRASSNTNVNWAVTGRIDFNLGYTYRYEDYGQLVWRDQWVQKPSWERRTHTIGFSMEYRPVRFISFTPGYSYQTRKSWDHFADLVSLKEVRSLSEKYTQSTLSVAGQYRIDVLEYIMLSAGRRVQKSAPGTKDVSDYAAVSVNRSF
jgi:hypothetical protein